MADEARSLPGEPRLVTIEGKRASSREPQLLYHEYEMNHTPRDSQTGDPEDEKKTGPKESQPVCLDDVKYYWANGCKPRPNLYMGLNSKERRHKHEALRRYAVKFRYNPENDTLYFIGRQKPVKVLLTADEVQEVISTAHTSGEGGSHVGIKKTHTLCSGNYYWRSMSEDVKKYVRTCPLCKDNYKKNQPKSAPMQLFDENGLPIIVQVSANGKKITGTEESLLAIQSICQESAPPPKKRRKIRKKKPKPEEIRFTVPLIGGEEMRGGTITINLQQPKDEEDEEECRLPAAAESTWTSANNVAIESAKMAQRVTFLEKSLQQGIYEHWPFQLDELPPYLTKMKSFCEQLVETRRRHAQEVMTLALTHMEQERDRMNITADALRSAAKLITVNYLGEDEARDVLDDAEDRHNNKLTRETHQERLSLELRRQGLEVTQPSGDDIMDPVKALTEADNQEQG